VFLSGASGASEGQCPAVREIDQNRAACSALAWKIKDLWHIACDQSREFIQASTENPHTSREILSLIGCLPEVEFSFLLIPVERHAGTQDPFNAEIGRLGSSPMRPDRASQRAAGPTPRTL
jgi:hypothetical protein|tara:strand:- start:278 stop:640 length:363 start_codon:yes stop_codon:yes gene_type:complete